MEKSNFKGLFTLAVIAMAFTSMSVFAQKQVSGTASAKILTPLALTQNSGLAFGEIEPAPTAGAVTISNSGGAPTSEGGVVIVLAGNAASWSVSGQPEYSYSISVDSTAVIASPEGETMNVVDIAADKGTGGTLDLSGADTFNVGGKLEIGANQASGDYNGTFNVTVAYN